MAAYVYLITNVLDGKQYVGKSTQPNRRWAGHLKEARREHSRSYVSRAIRAHGPANFRFQIVAGYATEDEAYAAERKLVISLGTTDVTRGYNLVSGGKGAFQPSVETRQRLSLSHMHRIDRSHPDTAPKNCLQCGETFFVSELPLTASRLKAHVKRTFCSRKCGTIWHNLRRTGEHRTDDVKSRISKAMKGIERSDLHIRVEDSHPDAQPKACIGCQRTFGPKPPLTPGRVRGFIKLRFCSRTCARKHPELTRNRRVEG